VRSPRRAIERFSALLNAAGIVTTTRKTRGDDIDAACGQLAGQIKDRTRRASRLKGRFLRRRRRVLARCSPRPRSVLRLAPDRRRAPGPTPAR